MMYFLVAFVLIVALWSVWGFFSSRVEQAEYTVIKQATGYEIRKYPSHIVAQTTVQGARGEAMSSGFTIVAGYIFGANAKKESIAMTAPVVLQKEKASSASENIAMTAPVMVEEGGGVQTISFGMPRSYTLETLPIPTDSRVKVVTVPEKKYAVMRFSGIRTDVLIQRMQEKLLAAVTRDGLETVGSVAYAGYNAPWTPPWMTRNEVLIEIK